VKLPVFNHAVSIIVQGWTLYMLAMDKGLYIFINWEIISVQEILQNGELQKIIGNMNICSL
jgi:hypothetical protein